MGCFDFAPIVYSDKEEPAFEGFAYSCEGFCTVCEDGDYASGCASEREQQANINSDQEEYSKYVCSQDADYAQTDCLAALAANVRVAFSGIDISGCDLATASPAFADASCEVSAGGVVSYDDATEPVGLYPLLGGIILGFDPAASSLVANWRGSNSTKAISGYAQVSANPWRLTFLKATLPDTTVGGETFNKPVLLLRRPQPLVMGSDLSYTLDLGGPIFWGSYARSGERVLHRIGLSGGLTGALNFNNNTFTGGFSLKSGDDSLVLNLAGAIKNRPPIAAFTTGAVSNCTVAVNGTGSSDPDGGSIQNYTWFVDDHARGTGATRSLSVHQGRNALRLVVTDNENSVSMPGKVNYVNVNANPPCQ